GMSADDIWVRQLDARQRAMLAEMGVKLWLPRPAATHPQPAAGQSASPAPEPAVAAPAMPARAPAPAPAPAPQARPRADIASLDWPGLREAVANCRACSLCESRRNTVFGVGNT